MTLSASPLIVPIEVEAFVANAVVRGQTPVGVGYERMQMNYGSMLADLVDGTPFAPAGSDANFTSPSLTDIYDGVYLKWRLPQIFTRGETTPAGTTFPLVPNRWLVVRFGGVSGSTPTETLTTWIVESDAVNGTEVGTTTIPYSETGSAFIAAPAEGQTYPTEVYLGSNTEITSLTSWSEPGGTPTLYAAGPGNAAFATYQPFNNNVFSLLDQLNATPAATLAYAVIGWYSEASCDPLANVTTLEELEKALTRLRWSADTSLGDVPNWTLYSGFVTGVGWVPTETPQAPVASGVPQDQPAVACAPSAIEGVTTLITAQAPSSPALQPDLLEALQLGQLQTLDQSDGAVLLGNAVLANGFQKTFGGSVWQITGSASPPLVAKLALAELNREQAKLDAARIHLGALQQSLYDAWWTAVTGGAQSLPPQLDPQLSSPPSLAYQVVRQRQKIGKLEKEVERLAEAMNRFPESAVQIASKPPFYLPKDPVMLVAGGGASGIAGNAPGRLPCRFPSQLFNAFTCDGSTIVPSTPAPPPGTVAVTTPADAQLGGLLQYVSGPPWTIALATALLDECFLLDPNNAGYVAGATGLAETDVQSAMSDPQATGSIVLPAPLAMGPWNGANPWHPIFLQWQGSYTPIEYATNGIPNWTFEGTSYSWNGTGLTGPSFDLQGLIVLSPAASMNLAQQVAKCLDAGNLAPNEQQGLAALQSYIDGSSTDDDNGRWDFLSQALDGFNAQLLMRNQGAYITPAAALGWWPTTTPSLTKLLGPAGGAPIVNSGTDTFQPWRSGQFNFSSLLLIDEWGQTMFLLGSGASINTAIVQAPEWQPPSSVPPADQPTTIQLPPTLLQPARLAFDLVSATDDAYSGPSVDPICGWVLTNLLDQSLMVYDAGGHMLGELGAGAGTLSQSCWTPAPGSLTLTPALIGNAHLRGFVETLAAQPIATFYAALAAIDQALTSIVPQGGSFDANLALLVGRPLALVRASLALELCGPPYADPTTGETEITSYAFGVQLGNVAQSGDGLVGYLSGTALSPLSIIAPSGAAADGYLEPIGPGNFLELTPNAPPQYVTLLLDPRLPVNAATAILPVGSVSVPPAYVNAALANMDVTFRVGALLTDAPELVTLEHPEGVTLRMPVPVEKGRWSWLEQHGPLWIDTAIVPADAQAHLSSATPVLRRGLLQLKTQLD